MILALGSLAGGSELAASNAPDRLLFAVPNVSTVFSQVTLIACAAGSCVMITSASSTGGPPIRRIAIRSVRRAG